jgi:hypothetical protein
MIDDMTPEQLKANHITIYHGGHHGNTPTIQDRVDYLEDQLLPPITYFPPDKPITPKRQPTNYELIDRINSLQAEVRYLEKKLNEKYDKKAKDKYVF